VNTCSAELVGVAKKFQDIVAVDQLNLSVSKGEFFAFLGPSGCGKTTTLRMIAGLEAPDAGEIYIGGECVNDLPPYERNVSTVFQRLALFPHLTVDENLAFGLKIQRRPREVIRKKVAEMLELVRLPGLERRYPDQLSGGQQQRVALARSLVLAPEVLLLDEPLAALDRKLRKEMQVELRRIQREVGITFIYVTHDQKEAISMSDRIAVMNDGRLIQMGTPREIYERPRTRFVADFMGFSNIFSGSVVAVNARDAEVQIRNGLKIYIEPQDGLKSGTELSFSIRPEAVQVFGKETRRSLDNCISGRVEEAVYLGDFTELVITLPQGLKITAHLHNHDQSGRDFLIAGAEVGAGWNRRDCQILLD
jgi:spermidine/putrescine transport system ATP-binding protein